MRRDRKRISKMKYYSIAFSTLCGVLLSAGMIVLFGLAGARTGFPDMVISILLLLSLSAGGFLSGFIYGTRKRHKGLINGAMCGVIMYAAVFIAGIIYLKGIPPFRLLRILPLLTAAGAIGGVIGVNYRIKGPPA